MATVVHLNREQSSSLIAEEEVTGARIASILEAAVIDHRVDPDGDIYASEGLEFPAWISIAPDKKLISFFTFYDPEDPHQQDLERRANDLNHTIVVVQFCWKSDRLWGHYWMTYDGGIDAKQFIKMLRRFSGAFVAGIEKFKETGETSPIEPRVRAVNIQPSVDVAYE